MAQSAAKLQQLQQEAVTQQAHLAAALRGTQAAREASTGAEAAAKDLQQQLQGLTDQLQAAKQTLAEQQADAAREGRDLRQKLQQAAEQVRAAQATGEPVLQ